MAKDCEHEFLWEDNWHENIQDCIDGIAIPVVCVKCGKRGHENYGCSCITDKDGKIVE